MQVSSRMMGHARSAMSLASSSETGVPQSSSKAGRVARHALYDVPQPTSTSLWLRRMMGRKSFTPPRKMRLRRARLDSAATCVAVGERTLATSAAASAAAASAARVRGLGGTTFAHVSGASSANTRPRIVLASDSGCSLISFCMKWSYEPFIICSASISSMLMARCTFDGSEPSRMAPCSSRSKRKVSNSPSCRCTISSSSSTMTLLVCSTTADASEDRKYSAPRPADVFERLRERFSERVTLGPSVVPPPLARAASSSLMARMSGEPRLHPTSSPGKCLLLKSSAYAPSSARTTSVTRSTKPSSVPCESARS
mmetsp:Transcript_13242/g.55498  ORF Transcript_13242/g.55498 Transcript_13242/m.55498 type:complete len:313 (-) Transcript_13242:761-1699(-)